VNFIGIPCSPSGLTLLVAFFAFVGVTTSAVLVFLVPW
jgi:hypothetical protein